MMAPKETKSTLSVLLYLIFILSPLLIASSATASESEQEYAKYIEDWSYSIDGFEDFGCSDDDYLVYEKSIIGTECGGRQFDDQGNTYVALYSRYSSTSFGGISFSSGFNIVKIAADGNIESNTVISQSGGSTSTSNRVLSFNVISEDVYYFSFNSYHSYNLWEFSSSVNAQNTASNQEIISYYDSGWQWAINAGSSSRTYDGGEVNGQGNTDWAVSSDGDLITLNYHDYDSNGNSQCFGQLTIEYRLQKYSASDGSIDWYRTIETCYGIYNNLFTDGTDILVYFDSLGPNVNIHGDSLDCEGTIGIGSGTYTGCHLFAKFSNSGQTLWSQTVDHTGVFFTKFKPVSSGILLAGHWQITWDFNTQNFTDFREISLGDHSPEVMLSESLLQNWI